MKGVADPSAVVLAMYEVNAFTPGVTSEEGPCMCGGMRVRSVAMVWKEWRGGCARVEELKRSS